MTDELWKYVSRETPKNRPVSQHAALFCLMWYSLLTETLWPPLRKLLSLQRWRCCLWIFLKSINMGIHRILEIFLNAAELSLTTAETVTKRLKLKDVGQTLEWEEGTRGQIGKIEKERTRRERMQASAFMSFQSSLSNKGLHREICRLWFFIQFWIGPIGGICLHKRETFGLGLSQAQTSMSQLSAAACQRRSFLPNSCNSEPNRCAWGCSKSNT